MIASCFVLLFVSMLFVDSLLAADRSDAVIKE